MAFHPEGHRLGPVRRLVVVGEMPLSKPSEIGAIFLLIKKLLVKPQTGLKRGGTAHEAFSRVPGASDTAGPVGSVEGVPTVKPTCSV